MFCRVVDNYGDIGVAWRLAADLAARGEAVRLWVDDSAPLAWMARGGAAGVTLQRWTEPAPDLEPGDVVVETFGCAPPDAFVRRMAAREAHAPVWINLEYLSAESYVERCHALPSPQLAGVGRGLTKWFFFPGFSEASGGLLREPGLAAARLAFDRDAWLARFGLQRERGERVISLFCYGAAARAQLLGTLAAAPTLLLLTPGAADRIALPRHGSLRVQTLPWLTQVEYDHLLWSCDLNFVRGEDSFVRAHWARVPFVWQPYPQADDLHARKLDAFLDRFLAATPPPFSAELRTLWRAWSGFAPWPDAVPDLSAASAWRTACDAWHEALTAQADLTTRLLRFVSTKR